MICASPLSNDLWKPRPLGRGNARFPHQSPVRQRTTGFRTALTSLTRGKMASDASGAASMTVARKLSVPEI